MIIHFTSEATPFYKRGGLGDVVGSLPSKLSVAYKNAVVSFFYKSRINLCELEFKGIFDITIQQVQYEFEYYSQQLDGVDFYFINMSDTHLFSDLESGESDLFTEDGNKPYQETSSFIIYLYFAKAALQLIDNLNLKPTCLFFHDWHVCGCFAFIENLKKISDKSKFSTILLIHNYEYQGEIFPDAFNLLDNEIVEQLMPVFDKYGSVSLLSLGLKNADYVATVSVSYAEELSNRILPHTGLLYLDLIKQQKIYALPNGIDDLNWSPQNSIYLSERYDKNSFEEIKAKAKLNFQNETGLATSDEPIILLMARITEQKGINLLIDLWSSEEMAMRKLGDLLAKGVKMIICGRPSGGLKGNIHKRLTLAQNSFPERFIYISSYNEKDAHRLLAIADIILCPSLFEPCGLVQLYGMSFGAVPLVRPVGGLKDTVIPHADYPESSTGFYINEFNHQSLMETMDQVLLVYERKDEWHNLVLRGMAKDFSWEVNIEKYLQLLNSIKDVQFEHIENF